MKKSFYNLFCTSVCVGLLSAASTMASDLTQELPTGVEAHQRGRTVRAWEDIVAETYPLYTEASNHETVRSYCEHADELGCRRIAIFGSGRGDVKWGFCPKNPRHPNYALDAYGDKHLQVLTVNTDVTSRPDIFYTNTHGDFSSLVSLLLADGGFDIIVLENLNIQPTGHERADYYYRSQESTLNLLKMLRGADGVVVLPMAPFGFNSLARLRSLIPMKRMEYMEVMDEWRLMDPKDPEYAPLGQKRERLSKIIQMFSRQLDAAKPKLDACCWNPTGSERYHISDDVFSFVNSQNGQVEHVVADENGTYIFSSEAGGRDLLCTRDPALFQPFMNEYAKKYYGQEYDFSEQLLQQVHFEPVQRGSDLWPKIDEEDEESEGFFCVIHAS